MGRSTLSISVAELAADARRLPRLSGAVIRNAEAATETNALGHATARAQADRRSPMRLNIVMRRADKEEWAVLASAPRLVLVRGPNLSSPF
jgi:hypothetical protein